MLEDTINRQIVHSLVGLLSSKYDTEIFVFESTFGSNNNLSLFNDDKH